MIPRGDVPRSTFVTTHSLKSTFDVDYLVPILVEEVLPADVHQGQVTIFARLSNLLFPMMDQVWLETFFFFVPCRLLWDNWKKMMGERTNPSDSISYTVPQATQAAGGAPVGSLMDYMGIPTVGQVAGGAVINVNALPFRAYQLIYNEWFRDENLQDSVYFGTGNGPDSGGTYVLLKRNKKPDYFTSALPWPLKGGVDVTMPLSGLAPVKGIAALNSYSPTGGAPAASRQTSHEAVSGWSQYYNTNNANIVIRGDYNGVDNSPFIFADMSTATGATINAIRTAIQTQSLLERDARSGTRYTELLRAHFGVTPEDARLQRPEYIGGGRTPVQTQAIPQTSATGLTGGTSPQGALSAQATIADQHSFSYNATEHGFIIGLVNVTGEVTYQQGLRRMWTRQTRLDHYWPSFAHLGEQSIRNDELYARGDANDALTFGYQERWAEYRDRPSMVTGLFKSTSAGTIDPWHIAQKFTSLPTLNTTFITQATPITRAMAAGAAANGMHVLFDSVFKIKSTRPLPMYSVPGFSDRF